MKRFHAFSLLLTALLACLSAARAQVTAPPPGLPGAGAAPGVALSTLHDFVPLPWANPNGLVQGSDGNFYGTTSDGGSYGFGTVYQLTSSGSLATLYSFTGEGDGSNPVATLVQGTDGNLYGTTQAGGASNAGTVFQITTGGSLTTLYAFTGGSDGSSPNALVQGADGNFYGTSIAGGDNGTGAIFQITSTGALTLLYSFTALPDGTNADGAFPTAALVQGADGNLYGTANWGGINGSGTVFEVSTSGSFTVLYSFTGGIDGSEPVGGVIQGVDGNFYGTTLAGGTNCWGTVFQLTTGTSGTLNTLYAFTGGSDGGSPNAVVQGNDGNLYGTAQNGGGGNSGVVFRVTTTGTLTTLYAFTGASDGAIPQSALIQGADGNFYGTNVGGGTYGDGTVFQVTSAGSLATLFSGFPTTDGANPSADLVQGSDGNFYGTTQYGGAFNAGTIFQMTPTGLATPIYAFTGGSDGSNPQSGLIQGTDGNYYGTTNAGGANGAGTVFLVSSSGALTTLYSFSAPSNGINPDGANPSAGVIQGSDGNFYGTTTGGGVNGAGTVFQVTSGGSLTTLYSFTGGNDGSQPIAGVIQGSDGNFYGTTQTGGANGWGTFFQLIAGGTSSTLNTLYAFTGGGDGGTPNALVQGTDGNFYGTDQGGANGAGTVFQLTMSGSCNTLYAFSGGNDGGNPQGGLIQATDGNFYGTTSAGGGFGGGTAFQVTSGGSLTTLYSFTGGNDGADPQAGLVQGSDGNFYGTTVGQNFAAANSSDCGTVFQLNISALSTGSTGSPGPVGVSPVIISGSSGPIWIGTPIWLGPVVAVADGGLPLDGAAGGGNPLTTLALENTGSLVGTAFNAGSSLSTAPVNQFVGAAPAANYPVAGATLTQSPIAAAATLPNIGNRAGTISQTATPTANIARATNSQGIAPYSEENANAGNPFNGGTSFPAPAPATPSGDELASGAAPVSSAPDSEFNDGAVQAVPQMAATGTNSVTDTYSTPSLNTAQPRGEARTLATSVSAEPQTHAAIPLPAPTIGSSAAGASLNVQLSPPTASAPDRRAHGVSSQAISAVPAALYIGQIPILSAAPPTPAYSAGMAAGTGVALSLAGEGR